MFLTILTNGLMSHLSSLFSRVLPRFERTRSLRPNTVIPEDLLGRDPVDLDTPEVAQTYVGKVVMITGAGGSIGSELCRQLLNCHPAKIVLFDQNEYNLYALDLDLRPYAEARGIAVMPYLGSVTDAARVTQAMRRESVEIILHAAAYKHVPLVELNEAEGARNNVFGTKTLADVAVQEGVERFILVSSDKAVRPTSIMGATKRLSELILQDLQSRAPKTKFAMVRFGNVLGSSGSVLPLFQSQIACGGPVTVTHPEMRRYFMTVSEATRLVLLAGAYAVGGDVFVLDMGRPQKIMDLARSLIHRSGRELKTAPAQDGIAIEIIGLRPGEKLCEELFVNVNTLRTTAHAKILRADEPKLSQIEMARLLRDAQAAIEVDDTERLRRLLLERLEGRRRFHERREA